ncbi:hypothetical protein [Rugamonas sp.]|uniref:hypothetical protein n=1 Tax=Rugamonas sp. TaxID=1926287 RepID=UPI0025E517E9|nr:hypothetical protein [Rugamonas sp.]
MPTIVTHRKVRIVMLEGGESIAAHCRRGDIAIVADAAGWWIHFVGADGALDSYDEAFATRDAALWAAKAAAEYGLE